MNVRGAIAGLLLALLLLPRAGHGQDVWIERGAAGEPRVQLYFFWSETCPHCQEARPFVEAIPAARPWVTVHSLEVGRQRANAGRYVAMARSLGEEASAVPALLYCGEMQVGWDTAQTSGADLLQRLDLCRARHAGEPAGTVAAAAPAPPQTPKLHLPLVGEVDPAGLSLPLLTVVIAGLDAFNPCAFFVLLFLLSLLVHQRSRPRMLAIGGVFVLCSGLMYFAFMAAWLNLFQFLGHVAWVTLAAGLLALLVGAINVKDFFAFERGVTLSIPESGKPGLYRRARAILGGASLPAMLGATVLLAVTANFYELLCTAGFPMVYTRILTLGGLSAGAHYLYLALYNLVYVIPLALIVLAFVRTMGARKLTEREGRLLKLLSGVMMLGLGVLLVAAPEELNNLGAAFGLVAAALVLTGAAARLTRT